MNNVDLQKLKCGDIGVYTKLLGLLLKFYLTTWFSVGDWFSPWMHFRQVPNIYLFIFLKGVCAPLKYLKKHTKIDGKFLQNWREIYHSWREILSRFMGNFNLHFLQYGISNCSTHNVFIYPNGLTDLTEVWNQDVLVDDTSFE